MAWTSPIIAAALAVFVSSPARVVEVRARGGDEPEPPKRPAKAKPLCGPALAASLREAVAMALPVGYQLRDVGVGQACAPRGPGLLRVQVQLPDTLQRGQNRVTTYVGAGDGPMVLVPADVALVPTAAAKAVAVVLRGSEVRVLVRSQNVTVQALAIAQESAGMGEPVQVLPIGAQRVVRGRVVDAQTVEVAL